MALFVRLYNWLHREEGQGMVEYGLILALIAVAVIVALSGLGSKLYDLFQGITGKLNTP
ncbi:MAG: Flp family type IVb pilin [Firmicutes bacterium]|nr:Flp family type IVb pilin [Bacillota bacterium]